MHRWISEMDYTLLDCFPELLNANSLLPSFKFDQANGQFLVETYLLIQSDTMNLSPQLIRNAVRISDTLSCGCCLSIRWTDLKFHTLVGGHICRFINHFFCSSFDLSKFFGKWASGTSCFSPNCVQ